MSDDVRDHPWMPAAEAVANGAIEGIDVAGCMQDVLREIDHLHAEISEKDKHIEGVENALKTVAGVMCNFPDWFYEEGIDVIVRRGLWHGND